MLGDAANRIDRIRGIFVVDQLRVRSSGGRTQSGRTLELVLVDNRWQRTGWRPRRVYTAPEPARPLARGSQAKLSLLYANGAAENHAAFTGEDIPKGVAYLQKSGTAEAKEELLHY